MRAISQLHSGAAPEGCFHLFTRVSGTWNPIAGGRRYRLGHTEPGLSSILVRARRHEILWIYFRRHGCLLRFGDDRRAHFSHQWLPWASIGDGRGAGGTGIECRCSRFDVAWHDCPLTPQQAYDEWVAGRVKTRVHKNQHLWISSTDGKTLYIGSRKSSKRVRIYERWAYTQCELQARKENAHALFMDYLNFPESLTA